MQLLLIHYQNELQNKCLIAINTLKIFIELRKEGIIIALINTTFKNLDRTLWYRVNYNRKLEKEFLNDSFEGSFKFLYPNNSLVINIKLAQAMLNEE